MGDLNKEEREELKKLLNPKKGLGWEAKIRKNQLLDPDY